MQPGEFVHAGQLGRLQHQLVLHVARPGHQVVAQGAAEQLNILRHITDVVAQIADIQLAHVNSIHQQVAGIRLIQADDQFGQRAFARAATADDADLLARTNHQVDAQQGGLLLIRVMELHLTELHRTLQSLALERSFVGMPLLRQFHHLVDRIKGDPRLLVARKQPGNLCERTQGAAAEHVTGDQAAHAQVAIDDLVHAQHDHHHTGQLLQQHGRVHGQTGEHARTQLQTTEGADGLLPQVLALALGIVDLDRIQAGQALDQARLTLGGQGHGALHGFRQRPLQQPANQRYQGKGQDRNPHQVPADHGDHRENQQGKWQVDDAGHGQRSEKITQALKFVDVLREAAHPRRTELHGHASDAFEQRGGDDQVGFLARQIQTQTAQGLEQQIEAKYSGDTNGQHPQGRFGLVRYDPVIHVHHEQWCGQADQVDQKTRGNRIDVQPAGTLEGVAKPGGGTRNQLTTVEIEFMQRLGEKHLPAVILGQRLGTDPHLAPFAFAGHDACPALIIPAQQNGAATIVQQQQSRHGQSWNLFQTTAQPAPLQTSAGGGAWQQFGTQTLFGKWQTCGQHRAADRFLVQAAQRQQAI